MSASTTLTDGTDQHPQAGESLVDVVSGIVEATGASAGVLTLFEPVGTDSDEAAYRLSRAQLDSIRPLLKQIAQQLSADSPHPSQALTIRPSRELAEEPSLLPGLQATAVPIEENDRVVGMLCIFRPEDAPMGLDAHPRFGAMVSDQVQVVLQNARLARRLAEEKRWLEAVIERSADGILILDAECRVVGFNPALARLSGRTASSARRRSATAVFGLTTRSGAPFCEQSCPIRTGVGDGVPVELQLKTRAGATVDIEANYALIRGDGGELLGAVVNIRDITERREAEELQSTFLSVVSHELQTPLAVIRGYAELLSEPGTRLPPEQLRQRLTVIKEESQRLSKMIENLLNASRIQAGGVELRREPLALPPIARQIAQRLDNVSAVHRVVVDMPDDLPEVLADPDRVHDVLTNLVENGIKYSPRGGTVRISGRYTGQEVVVSVADQGIGIPERERARVFERFSRLDSRLVRERKGAGLGLFICKAIVEAHGGRIWIEAAPGGGTRVSFSLPRQAPAQLPVLFGPRSMLGRGEAPQK